MAKVEKIEKGLSLEDPKVAHWLTLAAGLGFYILCILIPMVGPAAAHGSGSPGAKAAPYYHQNFVLFLMVLLVTLGIAGVATVSRLRVREAVGGGPLPKVAIGLTLACAFLLVALLAGWLNK